MVSLLDSDEQTFRLNNVLKIMSTIVKIRCLENMSNVCLYVSHKYFSHLKIEFHDIALVIVY